MYADVQKFPKGDHRSSARHLVVSNGDIRSKWSLWMLSLSYLSPIVEIHTCCCSKIKSQDMSCANLCKIPKPKIAYSEDLGQVRCMKQDPRFMSQTFARFRDLLKSNQRATLGYRPQANGQQERSVQTVMRSVRAYVAEVDQSDWDEHAECLMFALNTSRCEIRHSVLPGPSLGRPGNHIRNAGPEAIHSPRTNGFGVASEMQRDYGYALACAEDLQKKAKRARPAAQTRKWRELSDRVKAGFEAGDSLAHLWHGPFRIEGIHDDFRVKLKIPGTGYRVNPWAHISRLKPRSLFPKRPTS
ncbi:LOW QUALITY PROTEIN: hypothetical protein PHMEG_0002751 [Phytophthora megakarya]|uniref:Integrase catalytic domain-containing protein n=1 Tax=Phytophthora megakarya TaxID=4795 RepID=A0A225WXQ5_9STRA|nr:LOW QUALITY PROTEIN: hypothetical protein PHMEG_0002751 [Phytophthora megakarya]